MFKRLSWMAVLLCGLARAQAPLPTMGVINDTTLAQLNIDWPPANFARDGQVAATADGRFYFEVGGMWVLAAAGIPVVAASVVFPALTLITPCQVRTITVPGALVGMPVVISPNGAPLPDQAAPQPPWVSASDTVSWKVCAPLALSTFTVPVVVKVFLAQ